MGVDLDLVLDVSCTCSAAAVELSNAKIPAEQKRFMGGALA
jgi:hypothetical protein